MLIVLIMMDFDGSWTSKSQAQAINLLKLRSGPVSHLLYYFSLLFFFILSRVGVHVLDMLYQFIYLLNVYSIDYCCIIKYFKGK